MEQRRPVREGAYGNKDMIAAGIGIGSLSTEAIVFDNEKGILGYSIIPTGGSSKEAAEVSLVSEGHHVEDILHAIHNAIADRTLGLLERIGAEEPPVAMTGGVAKNIGVVEALEEKLQTPLTIYGEPQIVGSLGAALLAVNGL